MDFGESFRFIFGTWFIWVPIAVSILTWRFYQDVQRSKYLMKQKYAMLEISIPRDVHKSPEAMEIVINALNQRGGGAMDWRDRFWYGATLFPGSLEIASIEGNVYFFIRVNVKFKDVVMTNLYSQYPQVEINEVDDYTRYVGDFSKHQDSMKLFGAEYGLANKDAYPIKTYVDYGMDKAIGQLEEFEKIDPLTTLIEFMGSIGPGEQMWIQIVLRSDAFHPWRSEAEKEIESIMSKNSGTAEEAAGFNTLKLTPGEQDRIKAMERSLHKLAFECGIRAIYLAKKDAWKASRKGFLKASVWHPFESNYFNSIRRYNDTNIDYFYEKHLKVSPLDVQERTFFSKYINREFFDRSAFLSPFKGAIFTSEELATIFHLPGRVAESSSVERIEATKAEAPTNLPT